MIARKWQWSIRAMLIVTTIVGIVLAIAVRLDSKRRLVARIESLGGDVFFEFKPFGIDDIIKSQGKKFAIEKGEEIQQIYLESSKVTRRDMAWIASETNPKTFKGLFLGKTGVTDTVIEPIRRMTGLTELDLNDAEITDQGVGYLHRLSLLEDLSLDRTRITDAAMDSIATLSSLGILSLERTNITDASIPGLNKCSSLAVVILSGTKVSGKGFAALQQPFWIVLDDTEFSDDGMRELGGMCQLSIVSLARTKITDSGIESIAEFPELQELSVEGTDITDRTLELLSRSNSLISLNVMSTHVTESGVNEFRRRNPRCKVAFVAGADKWESYSERIHRAKMPIL